MNASCRKKFDRVEMRFYRRIMRISWVKKLSNEKVLQMVKMEVSLPITIRKRQLNFVGHVVRKEGLEKLVQEGKIKGRQRGRSIWIAWCPQ